MATIDSIQPGFAAIDLGAEKHYVAAAGAPVRSFGSCTADLRALCDWLREHHVTSVAMEATGVYWINPHDFLQQQGFKVTLFHGAHARNMPGRKTDVADCTWHAMLHSYGLLQSCFVPPEEVRRLRSFCRLRDDHLERAASHILHMQKALDLLNVRIHKVLSQLHGVSGMRIVEAILAGERDPQALAALCDQRVLAKKQAAMVAALEGNWQPHHLFALRQAHEAYLFCQKQVADCDAQIQGALEALNQDKPAQERPAGRKVKLVRHNTPQIEDLHGQLLTACGGRDAQLLPGIAPLSWMKLTGELGTDLSFWKDEKHFTAWLGLAPNRHQSGKRKQRVPRRRTTAGQIFREAVLSLSRSTDCALGEFYRRVRSQRGTPVAIVATARKLAELYWRVMVKGVEYAEEGLAEYSRRIREQKERALQKRAAAMGYILQPITAATPA